MSTTAPESAEADPTTQKGIDEILSTSTGDIVVVNPTPRMIRELSVTDDELANHDSVQILATESSMKEVRKDFMLAARVQQLIADGLLRVRVRSDVQPQTPIIVSEQSIVAVFETPAENIWMATDDEEIANAAFQSYSDQWDEGEEFSFRTPPLGRFRETFRERFTEEAEQDLFDLIEHLNTDPDFDNTDLNASIASLLIGAKHELLLYDLGRWGEDVGVASKATFSRSKTHLEHRGLLDTEKVPIDVGRPRLRLGFDEEQVDDPTLDRLAEIAKESS